MSSAPVTSTSTMPTREETTTRSPSPRPRAARSSGCISRWWRGRPRVSRVVLWSQELQSCLWRRPISSSSPSARRRRGLEPRGEPGQVVDHQRGHEVDPLLRRAQPPGHRRLERPRGRRPRGAPRAPPRSCGRRRPPGARRGRQGRRRAGRPCRRRGGVPRRSEMRCASAPKICQSCRWSSPAAKTAGVQRAVLRTAKAWKIRSYWSRSSALVGGRMTSAWRVVSLR